MSSPSATASTATVKWAGVDTHGARLTGWKISRNGVDLNGTKAWSTTLPSGARSFTFLSLKSSTTYRLALQAITTSGAGVTAYRTVTTGRLVGIARPLPAPPVIARVVTEKGGLAIAWTEADGRGLPITGWQVSRDGVDAGGTGSWSTILPAAATQFHFRNLRSDVDYHVSVQAVTSAGVGASSVRTVVDANGGSGPCDNAGARLDYYQGSVCDGFQWRSLGSPAIYNISGHLVTGGVRVTWTLTTGTGPNGTQGVATLQQMNSNGAGYIGQESSSNGSAKTRSDFVSGEFHPGHATFRFQGGGGVPGGHFDYNHIYGFTIT